MSLMRRRRRPSPQTAAVLEALAERGSDWSHGYDLCGRLGLKAGTVYPILMRLADRGQVETAWEQDVPRGRPPRHLYRLSPAGAALVAELRALPPSALPAVGT
jgi:DNA-binding PadR family transcriptional regulator